MTQLAKAFNELSNGARSSSTTRRPGTCSRSPPCARRLKRRRKIGLIVVDYIQLVDSEDSRDSRQEQIAKISRRLKTLARELKVPVVALSQLNRAVESREDRRPRMADLRESGAIEQDADIVLLLHRPEYYDANDQPGIAELIVAKNRNGPTGNVKLTFLKNLTRFENLATVAEPLDEAGEPVLRGFPECVSSPEGATSYSSGRKPRVRGGYRRDTRISLPIPVRPPQRPPSQGVAAAGWRKDGGILWSPWNSGLAPSCTRSPLRGYTRPSG